MLLGQNGVERQRSLPGATLDGGRAAPFVGQEMVHGREQKGAKPSTRAVEPGEIVAREQTGEEFLREILGLVFIVPLPPDVEIERTPISRAQFLQRLARDL